MLNQFSCQWERQRKGETKSFSSTTPTFFASQPRRQLKADGNWWKLPSTSRIIGISSDGWCIQNIFTSRNKNSLTFTQWKTADMSARPPPPPATSIFVFNFDWGLLNLSRDSCAFDATQQMLDCFRHRQVIGTRGTEIDKRRKNVSIKLSADRVLDCLLSGKSLAVVDRCDDFGLD